MKVAVFGTGYVGLVQGACLAFLGHDVTCVDIDEAKIKTLKQGKIPFFEQGLSELVFDGLKKKTLSFTTNAKEAISNETKAVFVCVQTPRNPDGTCNISFVESVIQTIDSFADHPILIVLKSTVPPGIHKDISHSDHIRFASNPEFLREGSAVHDFFHPDRIVFGVDSAQDESLLQELHAGIDAPVFVMSVVSAQLTKYAANTMLASRLSLINEIANIADVLGADVKDVEAAVGADARIGSRFLRSGAGFGGSCFPKDVLALHYAGKAKGYTSRLIEPIIAVNNDQPGRFVNLVEARLGNLDGKKLAVWGLTFASNTDDTRESPAIKIIRLLLKKGAEILAYDPKGMKAARTELGDTIGFAESMEAALPAEALLVLTEWSLFNEIHWQEVADKVRSGHVFDGKNFLDRDKVETAGLTINGIGLCKKE